MLTLRESAIGGSKAASLSARAGDSAASRFGCGHDHAVSYSRGARDENAKCEAGKNVRVVHLRNAHKFAVDIDGRKRTAGAHDRAAVSPAEQIGGRGLGLRSWIRERKDHRARSIEDHRARNLFSECSRLSAHPRQNRDARIAHHIQQRNPSRFSARGRKLPTRHVFSLSHQGCLFRPNALATLNQQPIAIKRIDARAGLFSLSPCSCIVAMSRLMMPIPADPEPNMAIVCSASGTPVAFTAASSVAVVTAAVPWMSSLNVQSRLRYRSRRRAALAPAKSSHCKRTCGQRRSTAVTYRPRRFRRRPLPRRRRAQPPARPLHRR